MERPNRKPNLHRAVLGARALVLLLTVSGCGIPGPAAPAPGSAKPPVPTFTSTSIPTSTPTPPPTSTARPTTPTVEAPAGSADAAYAGLLDRVKASDPTVDFTEFRMAYTRTSHYDPYDSGIAALTDSMLSALSDKNYDLAIRIADRILEKDYIYPDAHAGSIRAHEALGQAEEAAFHHYVLNGLIGSISDSGDGRTPRTAYKVVLIEEEYLILSVLGIKPGGQSVLDIDGHSYDVLDGLYQSAGGRATVYFNIDIPFRSLLGP